ncbi:MAG TPA: hypothetical protein PKE06_01215 [Flavilitoribacter sp.]|nr:hypothetical protein [Flavilitoribacter sp.]HMQ86982.1 hypothetical protein [Flavilitoribacter sp.]
MEKRRLVKELEKDLAQQAGLLAKVSDTILDQDISRYPIFVLSAKGLEIGVAVAAGDERQPWYISASTLEELAARQVIGMEKVDDFRRIFKDPQEFFCFLVIFEEQADFVFMPRNIQSV